MPAQPGAPLVATPPLSWAADTPARKLYNCGRIRPLRPASATKTGRSLPSAFSPKRNLTARLLKAHSPDCLAGQGRSPHLELQPLQTEDHQHLEGTARQPAAARSAICQECHFSTAEVCLCGGAAQQVERLKQQLRCAREQHLAAAASVQRMKRQAAGWRDKFAALSESEKKASIEVHLMAEKVAEREDMLRKSAPHKQVLEKQMAEMRSEADTELRLLHEELASAQARAGQKQQDAEAARACYEERLQKLMDDHAHKVGALQQSVVSLERECTAAREAQATAEQALSLVKAEQQLLLQEQLAHAQAAEEDRAPAAAEIAALRHRLAGLESALQAAERERDDGIAAHAEARAEVQRLHLQVQHEQQQSAERSAARSSSGNDLGEVQAQLEMTRRALEAAVVEQGRAEREVAEWQEKLVHAKAEAAHTLSSLQWQLESKLGVAQQEAEWLRAQMVMVEEAERAARQQIVAAQQSAARAEERAAREERAHAALKADFDLVEAELRKMQLAMRTTQQQGQDFIAGVVTFQDKIALESVRIAAALRSALRERDTLAGQVQALSNVATVQELESKCVDLRWQLNCMRQLGALTDAQARAKINHLEIACEHRSKDLTALVAQWNQEWHDLTAQVAHWKEAHASMLWLEQSPKPHRRSVSPASRCEITSGIALFTPRSGHTKMPQRSEGKPFGPMGGGHASDASNLTIGASSLLTIDRDVTPSPSHIHPSTPSRCLIQTPASRGQAADMAGQDQDPVLPRSPPAAHTPSSPGQGSGDRSVGKYVSHRHAVRALGPAHGERKQDREAEDLFTASWAGSPGANQQRGVQIIQSVEGRPEKTLPASPVRWRDSRGIEERQGRESPATQVGTRAGRDWNGDTPFPGNAKEGHAPHLSAGSGAEYMEGSLSMLRRTCKGLQDQVLRHQREEREREGHIASLEVQLQAREREVHQLRQATSMG